MCKAAGPTTPLAGLASPSHSDIPRAQCTTFLHFRFFFCPQNWIFEYISLLIDTIFSNFLLQLRIISQLISFFFNSIITMVGGRILILNVSVENIKKCQLSNRMSYKNFSIKLTSFFIIITNFILIFTMVPIKVVLLMISCKNNIVLIIINHLNKLRNLLQLLCWINNKIVIIVDSCKN